MRAFRSLPLGEQPVSVSFRMARGGRWPRTRSRLSADRGPVRLSVLPREEWVWSGCCTRMQWRYGAPISVAPPYSTQHKLAGPWPFLAQRASRAGGGQSQMVPGQKAPAQAAASMIASEGGLGAAVLRRAVSVVSARTIGHEAGAPVFSPAWAGVSQDRCRRRREGAIAKEAVLTATRCPGRGAGVVGLPHGRRGGEAASNPLAA